MDFLALTEDMDTEKAVPVITAIENNAEGVVCEKMKASIESLKGKAACFSIENRNSAIVALEMAMQARKLKKAMEETRKEITRPHIEFQKAVKKIADSYSEKLDAIEQSLIEKLDDYRTEQDSFESLKSSEGFASVVSNNSYIIEDASEVPAEFWKIDEKALQKAINAGIREIAGIKIVQTENIVCRVKN